MSTYLYRCPECEREQESENFRDTTLFCNCDGQAKKPHQMQRVYTFSGVVFKGSGFAKTDNRTQKREQII